MRSRRFIANDDCYRKMQFTPSNAVIYQTADWGFVRKISSEIDIEVLCKLRCKLTAKAISVLS